jgi:hypothetical protein
MQVDANSEREGGQPVGKKKSCCAHCVVSRWAPCHASWVWRYTAWSNGVSKRCQPWIPGCASSGVPPWRDSWMRPTGELVMEVEILKKARDLQSRPWFGRRSSRW